MKEIKENRLRDEVVVPVSPAIELKICVMKRASDWMAWWGEDPEIWNTGTTLQTAIGRLMLSLSSEDMGVEIDIKERTS